MPTRFAESKFVISCDIAPVPTRPNPSRTALLIRCSRDDAQALRAQALAEHRSISGCLLHILDRSLWIDEQFARALTPALLARQAWAFRLARQEKKEDRTTMLLRCSVQEAARIRAIARIRQMSISEFVVFALWRYWKTVSKL